jgi:hypothetical protein
MVTAAFAQDNLTLPASQLKKMNPHTARPSDMIEKLGATKTFKAVGNAGLATGFAANASLPGVDSVVNFSDQFTTPGFDGNGNPQSVWPYTMVGNPPEAGGFTQINAPVIPVVVDLLLPDGTIFLSFSGNDNVKAALNSPMFLPYLYTSGIGQYNDQMQRATFWNRIHNHGFDNGWHTSLTPKLKQTRHMRVPFFTPGGARAWFVFVDNSGNPVLFALDEGVFVNLLFPTTVPVDNTTLIGAAELAGDMRTRDITTFLFNNVALFEGNINNCCILGFHTYDFEPGDAHNGNRERRYVFNFNSWLSPGLFLFGFQDATAMSHEMAELFNDPFVNNATPWWENVDPFAGFGICQNNLETGDVIEIQTSLPVYTVAIGNQTYHLSNEAMLPWFAFESPSTAHLGAYTFPDESSLTTLSPPNLLPGCVPAP